MRRWLAVGLLILNGALACLGGVALMTDPTGGKLSISTELLQHSPFADFFMPGLYIFILRGILNLAAAILIILSRKLSPYVITASGFLLCSCLAVQSYLSHTVSAIQFFFACTGIIILILGVIEIRNRQRQPCSQL